MVAVEAFVRDIVIVLVAAFFGGSAARRFQYPAAMGELLAGVIIGPFALGFVEYSDTLVTFAELGAIILLFYIGLNTDIAMLKRYLRPSVVAAVAGAVLPLGLGYYGGLLLGLAHGEAPFMGTVVTASAISRLVRIPVSRRNR